jgi:YbbR domain-containing protein
MNTLFSTNKVNILRKALASVAFSAVVMISPAISAQTITAQSHTPAITKSAEKFDAVIFPVENTLKMKINFVNPQEENVTVTIYDANNKQVYKRVLGNNSMYRGKFDLSMLSDGNYTVNVKGSNASYSRKISIKTQQERIASAF